MNFSNWQNIAALLCVFVAAAAIVRRAVRFFSGDGSSGCESCPAKSEAGKHRPERLITFDQITIAKSDDDSARR